MKLTRLLLSLLVFSPAVCFAQEAPTTGYLYDPNRSYEHEPKLPIAIMYSCEKDSSGILECTFKEYQKSTLVKDKRYCYSQPFPFVTGFLYFPKSKGASDYWRYEKITEFPYCDMIYREFFYPVSDSKNEGEISGWRYVTERLAKDPYDKSASGELCARHDNVSTLGSYLSYPDDSLLKKECDEIVEGQ
jgi:hypothetical protein